MNKNLIIRSSVWTFAGFGGGQALRLLNNLILTRLLAPEAFGLMALVTIFLTGVQLFTDLGIGASIIQNKRGDQADFVNTAWTIKVIRGIVIGVCICLVAGPLSTFYNEAQLLQILPLVALAPVLAGFTSNALELSTRKLWIGRITLMELGCRVAGVAFMVSWALISPTVWALAAGNVFAAFLRASASHVLFPRWRPRFRWDREAMREILHFGKWIFLTSALVFVASQIDRLTLAKLVPFDLVGLYSIGFMWAMLPHQVVQNWGGRVFFPFASELIRQPDGDRRRLMVYRRRLVWLCATGIGVFGGISFPIFHLFYTPTYWLAADFMNLILFGTLVKILDELYRPLNLALGQPVYTTIGSALSLLTFGLLVYPFYDLYAAHGIAAAYSISQVGSLVASAYGARRAGLTDLTSDLLAVSAGLAIWALLYFATANLV